MFIYKNRHSILRKSITITLVCLFLTNGTTWAGIDSGTVVNKTALAKWLLTKALTDEKVNDPAEVMLEAVTGIHLLASGKTARAVNNILTDNACIAHIEVKTQFLDAVQREDDITTARFTVIGENKTFQISLQNGIIACAKINSDVRDIEFALNISPAITNILGEKNIQKIRDVLKGKIDPDRTYGRRSYMVLRGSAQRPDLEGKVLVIKGYTPQTRDILLGNVRMVRHSGKGKVDKFKVADENGRVREFTAYEGSPDQMLLLRLAEREHRFNTLLSSHIPGYAVQPVGIVEFKNTRLRYHGDKLGAVMMIIDDIDDQRVGHIVNRLAASPIENNNFKDPADRISAEQLKALLFNAAEALKQLHSLGIIHRYFHLGNLSILSTSLKIRDLDAALSSEQMTPEQFINWVILDLDFFIDKVQQEFFGNKGALEIVLGNEWKRGLLLCYFSGDDDATKYLLEATASQIETLSGYQDVLRKAIERRSTKLRWGQGIKISTIAPTKRNPYLSEVIAGEAISGDAVMPDPILPFTKRLSDLSEQDRYIATGNYAFVVSLYEKSGKTVPTDTRDLYNLVIALLVRKQDAEARKIFNANKGHILRFEALQASVEDSARDIISSVVPAETLRTFIKEGRSTKSLDDELVRRVRALPGGSIVYLAAPTAAGKSRASQIIAEELGNRVLEFPLDAYFKPAADVPMTAEGLHDFDSPDAIDLDRAVLDIKSLLAGQPVMVPQTLVNRWENLRKFTGKQLRLQPGGIIIVDSIHALHQRVLDAARDRSTLNIFLRVPAILRLERRLKRDKALLHKSYADTLRQWPVILRQESATILPYAKQADIVFDSYSKEEFIDVAKNLAMMLAEELLERPSSEERGQIEREWRNVLSKTLAVDSAQHESLSQTQLHIQNGATKTRNIEDYDHMLTNANSNFSVQTYLGQETLRRTVRWADIGCGLGVALSEAAERFNDQVIASGVDLIDWNEATLTEDEVRELFQKFEPQVAMSILEKRNIHFLKGDMSKVVLNESQDLITIFFVLYYSPDPLRVFANFFNQLSFHGILLVHLLIPEGNEDLINFYERFAGELKPYASTEIYRRYDQKRKVWEIVIRASRTSEEKIQIQPSVISVQDREMNFGRKGRSFSIKVVRYNAAATLPIIARAPPLEQIVVKDSMYDVESALYVMDKLIPAELEKDKIYEIKYDTARLSLSQKEIVEEYVKLLKTRSADPDRIKLKPFSSAQGSKESLIAVYCTGKSFKGEGHVSVSMSEGDIQDYLLNITGMLNIAFASSNIPDNFSKEDIDKYRPILSYINNQYKAILGEELAIPDNPENILKIIRRIVLGLPKSARRNPDQIEEYNRFAKEALTAA